MDLICRPSTLCPWTSQSVPLLHFVSYPTVRPARVLGVLSLLVRIQGNTGPTKPLRPRLYAAPPQLFGSLTGSLSSSLRCTKAQHVYLRDRHLVSYADVIAWTGTSWRWQNSDLPFNLLEALRGLTLPVSESVPYCSRAKRDISLIPRSWSRTGSQKSIRSPPTAHPVDSGTT